MLGKLKALFGGRSRRGKAHRAEAEPEPQSDDEDVSEVEVAWEEVEAPQEPATVTGGTEQALIAGELRAAQKIQMSLVPKTFPPIPGCLPFDLYAILEPAQEIGGDFYDFWLNGRDNLVLVIGDVSGKGIPAALFMAVCRTYLRAFSRSLADPAKLVEYLNNEVSRHNESCMFVTLICAVVHIPTGRVTYANAGHNPPYLRKRDGSVKALDLADDMPVGFMNGVEFTTRTLTLETGDSLLFYTDGMPEAFNAAQEMLGEERSLELFREASGGGSCRTAIGQLRAEVSEFAGAAEQSDDITLMMYGQLEQGRGVNLEAGRDDSGALEGDTGMYSLSNMSSSIYLKPGQLHIDSELGRSLSGMDAGRFGHNRTR